MPVWYAIPSANPEQCERRFDAWHAQGYLCAVLVDGPPERRAAPRNADFVLRTETYHGYPWAVARLCQRLLCETDTPIVVTGGDDMLPDPGKRADEIAAEFLEHFPDTLGVMQPCGDPFGMDANGVPAAARICGSPWMGREFIERVNGGRGPFWRGYRHYYCDEEMHNVAANLSMLWQRPDLTQWHDHWTRPQKSGGRRKRPDYLAPAEAKWQQDKALFLQRKSEGFPGHELLPARRGSRDPAGVHAA